MIIIPIQWLFHWEYSLFSDKPSWWFSSFQLHKKRLQRLSKSPTSPGSIFRHCRSSRILMSTNFLMPLMMLVGPEGDQAEWEHYVGNRAIKLPWLGMKVVRLFFSLIEFTTVCRMNRTIRTTEQRFDNGMILGRTSHTFLLGTGFVWCLHVFARAHGIPSTNSGTLTTKKLGYELRYAKIFKHG